MHRKACDTRPIGDDQVEDRYYRPKADVDGQRPTQSFRSKSGDIITAEPSDFRRSADMQAAKPQVFYSHIGMGDEYGIDQELETKAGPGDLWCHGVGCHRRSLDR